MDISLIAFLLHLFRIFFLLFLDWRDEYIHTVAVFSLAITEM